MMKSYVIYSATATGDRYIATVKTLADAKKHSKELQALSDKMGGVNIITYRAVTL